MRRSIQKFQKVSLALVVVAAVAVAWTAEAAPVGAGSVVFAEPTDAAVLDPFRLPNGPYAAGNRGIEYDTRDGDPVVAAAAGDVVFAGAVAGSLFVTVDHGDGLKSTYGFVAHLLVSAGDRVAQGDKVAVAGGPFHFGTRLRGDYIDPAPLFGIRLTTVRLVPHDEGGGRVGGDLSDDRLAVIGWVQAERARDAGRLLASRLRSALENTAVNGGLGAGAATLLDGPIGPRTVSGRRRRKQHNSCPPGRLGVRHEDSTGKKEHHGSHLDEAAAGGRRPLRPSDPPLEPEDEAVHPR